VSVSVFRQLKFAAMRSASSPTAAERGRRPFRGLPTFSFMWAVPSSEWPTIHPMAQVIATAVTCDNWCNAWSFGPSRDLLTWQGLGLLIYR
jgi:hypothetical protein